LEKDFCFFLKKQNCERDWTGGSLCILCAASTLHPRTELYVYTLPSAHVPYLYVYTLSVYVNMYAPPHVPYLYVCVWVGGWVGGCVYAHIHTHTYMHSYIHTHNHKYTVSDKLFSIRKRGLQLAACRASGKGRRNPSFFMKTVFSAFCLFYQKKGNFPESFC
jgi:hypothetical protein